MLVLTRKVGKRIFIGNKETNQEKEITISVTSIDRDSVRLAISADKKWEILREEVYDRIQEDNRGNK